MGFLATTPARSTSWPITVVAEGIAAAQFARCGFDVLVQANRDKPWYDLVVTRAGNLLKVSVKASDDGEWRLTSGYTRSGQAISAAAFDARSAVDRWLASYGSRTVCCLVQFQGVAFDELPRIYLALPTEVAHAMRQTADRIGLCGVKERYEWTRSGSTELETMPDAWRFSPQRIEELLAQHSGALVGAFGAAKSGSTASATRELAPEVVFH